MLLKQWYGVQILDLLKFFAKHLKEKFSNFFQNLKYTIFCLIKKCCQSLVLDNILLCFYIITLEYTNLVMVRKYLIVI